MNTAAVQMRGEGKEIEAQQLLLSTNAGSEYMGLCKSLSIQKVEWARCWGGGCWLRWCSPAVNQLPKLQKRRGMMEDRKVRGEGTREENNDEGTLKRRIGGSYSICYLHLWGFCQLVIICQREIVIWMQVQGFIHVHNTNTEFHTKVLYSTIGLGDIAPKDHDKKFNISRYQQSSQ